MTQSTSLTREAGDHGTSHGAALQRAGRVGFRMLAAVALIGGSVAFAGLADSTTAFAADGACDGVTVVVDFTDIGGELEVGCAEGEQESGRTALLAAGFTATDSQPGLLCAINSMPDPCPEVFDGNFWSYWFSTPDGEWESYQVGADSSQPAQGELEGWRYNDGTTPPGVAPADAADALPAPAPEATETTETTDEVAPGGEQAVTSSTLGEQQSAQNTVLTIVTVGFLALVAAFVVFFVVRRRRNGSGSGGSGTGGSGTDRSGSSD